MNRQILKAQADVPLVVLLDQGPEGKETRSQRDGALQYQYTVNDDKGVMWLPPEARAAILRTGAQAGDQIEILKSLRGKNAFWNVQVLSDASEPAPTKMVAPRPAYRNGNGHPAAASQPAAAPATVHPHEELMARCIELGARANLKAHAALKAAGIELDEPTWEDARATGTSFFIEPNKSTRDQQGGAR